MGVLIIPNETIIVNNVNNKIWVDKTINSILARTPANLEGGL